MTSLVGSCELYIGISLVGESVGVVESSHDIPDRLLKYSQYLIKCNLFVLNILPLRLGVFCLEFIYLYLGDLLTITVNIL